VTAVNPGAGTNSTANVAGRLAVAWWDSQGTGLVGPQGQNIPLGGGGVGISAGANFQSTGTVNFSNANGVTFGLDNFGNLTATVIPGAAAGLAAVEAGTQTQTSGTLVFANSNGLTFGMSNNSVITGSYTVPTQTVQTQASGNLAGTGFTSTTTNGTAIVGTNNTAGLSLAYPLYLTTYVGQTTQTQPAGNIAGAGTTTTTQAGSTLGATQNSNGLSLAVPVWITTYAGQTTQTQPAGNIAGIGTTTTTQGGSTLGATLSTNGLSLAIPAWLTVAAGGGGFTGGVSTGGNTVGNTGAYTGQMIFAGGNNITLSVSSGAGGAQSITISGANAGGAQTGISGIIVSNTTYTSGTVSFSNANGFSFGSSAGQAITGSYTVPSVAGLISAVAVSGGAGNSVAATGMSFLNSNGFTFGVSTAAGAASITGSYTVPVTAGLISYINVSAGAANANLTNFTLSNSNGISFGLNASTITASYTVPSTAGLISGLNISGGAGNSQSAVSGVTFSNANGITFGVSTGANVVTVTASYTVPAAGLTTGGYYATGNTTNNSSTTLALSAQSFNALGAMTMGFSNGSIQVSAPATSSISGTGLVSISVNASTISIGAALAQLSFYQPLGPVQNTTVTQNGAGSVQVYPAIAAFPFTATRADIMASVSAAALALSTEAQTLSLYLGLYSLNGSTLSLASSGSQSYAWTNSSGGSTASITGMRRFSAPINVNYTGGFDLFVGIMTNTTFANTNGISLSNMVVPLGPGPQLQGLIGQTQVNSMQFVPGQGFFSVTSAAMPVSMGLSAILGAGSGGNAVDYYAPLQFVNITA
jgi:hypothetical protein